MSVTRMLWERRERDIILTYLCSSKGVSVRAGLASGASWKTLKAFFLPMSWTVSLNSSSSSAVGTNRRPSTAANGLRKGAGLRKTGGAASIEGFCCFWGLRAAAAFFPRGARMRGALTLTLDRVPAALRVLRFFGVGISFSSNQCGATLEALEEYRQGCSQWIADQRCLGML